MDPASIARDIVRRFMYSHFEYSGESKNTVEAHCANAISQAVEAAWREGYQEGQSLNASVIHKGAPVPDLVIEAVRADLLRRSELGLKKYGAPLNTNGNTLRDRLQHAYEEMLDGANYLKGAIMQIDGEI